MAILRASVAKAGFGSSIFVACTEGWPSGQWQQTVNLPTYVYVGSNPTPSTTRRSG